MSKFQLALTSMGPVFNLCENLTSDVQIFTSLWLLRLGMCDVCRWILGSAEVSLAVQKGKGLRVECQFAE